jgi:hypothetical protein
MQPIAHCQLNRSGAPSIFVGEGKETIGATKAIHSPFNNVDGGFSEGCG